MTTPFTSSLGSSDPLIALMLSNRQIPTDLSPENELETRNRLYTMLRHSKTYKRLQVARANEKWMSGNDLTAPISNECQSPSSGNLLRELECLDVAYDSGVDVGSSMTSRQSSVSAQKKRDRRVSFSDKIEFYNSVPRQSS